MHRDMEYLSTMLNLVNKEISQGRNELSGVFVGNAVNGKIDEGATLEIWTSPTKKLRAAVEFASGRTYETEGPDLNNIWVWLESLMPQVAAHN